jgi:hypothetical protein
VQLRKLEFHLLPLLLISHFKQVCEACWVREFGEASEEERVAQLAARVEGQLGANQAEEDQAINQEQPYSYVQEEGSEQRGEEGECGTVIKTPMSMPLVSTRAAGSAAAAVRQQVIQTFLSTCDRCTHSNLQGINEEEEIPILSTVNSSGENAALVSEVAAAMRKEISAMRTENDAEMTAAMTAMRKEIVAEMTAAMRKEMAAMRKD